MPERPHLQANRYKDSKAIVRRLRELHEARELEPLQEKLLFSPRRPTEELYDLEADPFELTNLADDPEYRSTLEDMKSRLADWEKSTGDQGRQPEPMAVYGSDMEVYLSEGAGSAGDEELRRNIELNKRWAADGK